MPRLWRSLSGKFSARALGSGAPCSFRGDGRTQLGFTLVELMAVVVIVGVLAMVGIMLFRRHIFSAKSTEAMSMVQSIRAAEERWRAETNSYLDVSTTLESYYPMSSPGRHKMRFENRGSPDYPRWRLLNPTAPGLVQFGYSVKAGPPGQSPPTPATREHPDLSQASSQSWYLIQAKGDTDQDGTPSYYLASSFSGGVYAENEGE